MIGIGGEAQGAGLLRHVGGSFLSRVHYAGMIAILLLPAIWNGFPFIFADTGGYLARPLEGNLELGRSALYGAFLATGIHFNFWPNIILQAGLVVWLISLILREHEFCGRPFSRLATVLAMVGLTSIPWYAGQLMPDVFVPLSVLAVYLLAFTKHSSSAVETVGLGVVVAFGVAAHMSILGLMLGLLIFFVCLHPFAQRLSLPRPNLAPPAAAVGAGIALALTSNFIIGGSLSLTPGGPSFLFGRLLEDGIVKRYLDTACPHARLRLCGYRNELPAGTDDWLWAESPLGKLGGWRAFEEEAGRIIVKSLLSDPIAHLTSAASATVRQFGMVKTGDGFNPRYNWHAEMILTQHAPNVMQEFRRAAQQRDELSFIVINVIHAPLAMGASLALAVITVWSVRRRRGSAFALTIFSALLINAAICGIFAGTGHRYQSRLASIAVLAAGLSLCQIGRLISRVDGSSAQEVGGKSLPDSSRQSPPQRS